MRKISALLIISALSIASIFSAEFSFDVSAYGSWETNKFSNPLPLNASESFLNNVVDHPYIDRKDIGGKLNMNIFFVSGSRSGLSLSFSYGHALSATETIPEGDFKGEWEYVDYDALESQIDKISIGLGGIFRHEFSFLEIGAAIRGVISSFDYFRTFTVGIEAEPYLRTYFRDYVYAAFGLSFTAHIFHFIDSDTELYETNFTRISLAPYIGIGFRFGAAGGNE